MGQQFGGRAILLIRSPLDSILSFWNHANAAGDDGQLVQKNYLLKHQVRSDRFKSFVISEIE